jgi:hypothetical protein
MSTGHLAGAFLLVFTENFQKICTFANLIEFSRKYASDF